MRVQDHLANIIDATGEFNETMLRDESIAIFKKQIVNYKKSGLSLIEAITSYCEDNAMDVEDIISYMDQTLLAEMTTEATSKKLIKKQYRANSVEF